MERSLDLRSCSRLTRSRSSCRFCASRISGAAYEAWSDRARVRKMNGYSSKRSGSRREDVPDHPQDDDQGHPDDEPPGPQEAGDLLGEAAERLRVVRGQQARPGRARQVEAGARAARHGARPRRARAVALLRAVSHASPLGGVELRLAPVLGQQVVEDVVDGDRAQQRAAVVHDGRGDHVVRGEERGDGGQRGLRGQRRQVVVHDRGDQGEGRVPQQPLEVHRAQVLAGRRLVGRPATRTPARRARARGPAGVRGRGRPRPWRPGAARSARWSSDRPRCAPRS